MNSISNNKISASHQIAQDSPSKIVGIKSLIQCSSREARRRIPENIAIRANVLPLAVFKLTNGELITVATRSTLDFHSKRELEFIIGANIKEYVHTISQDLLDEVIFKAYHRDSDSLDAALSSLNITEGRSERNLMTAPKLESGGDVGNFLTKLIEHAAALNATDIHLVSRPSGTEIKIRVDGLLCERSPAFFSSATHSEIIRRTKILAGLSITETRRPQEGAFSLPHCKIRVRASILPTVHGENLVLRIFGTLSSTPSLLCLGYNESEIETLLGAINADSGAVLLCGPTGSGKSTTLYALADELAQQSNSVLSIEDPVEVIMPSINQTSIDRTVGFDYPSALKAALRHDPDALLIGEIRDVETAKTALSAALTGHIVLTTVHAGSTEQALTRLMDLEVKNSTLLSAVNLIVAQRLVCVLCSNCKVTDLTSSNELGFEVKQPVGCPYCEFTGFDGKTVIAEFLSLSNTSKAFDFLSSYEGKIAPKSLNENPYLPSAMAKLRAGLISIASVRSLISI